MPTKLTTTINKIALLQNPTNSALINGTIPPTLAISWQIRQSIINENDTEKEASIRCVLKSGSFSLLLLPKPKGI
ncbi:MAG: hypothetical protein QN720_11570 [Nitrososphaeraceae archaeon]|nr:hypothetical protein [Nitrososphaeraceae archaeon]MDW0333583.1 hypothetical protein [Nitrososphaeraceae archaeon]